MILQGDCLEELKKLETDSVDVLITDPPYGYSFMGKDWDTFNEVVSPGGAFENKKGFKKLPRNKPFGLYDFMLPIWKEVLRVLKPGAFGFVMCAPRQDVLCKQISALSDAGFRTDFTSIYWTYASGFPKAHNISKSIDKKGGKWGEGLNAFVKYVKECRDSKGLSNKEIDDYLGLNSNGATASHYTCVDGQQPRFPRMSLYPKLKEVLGMDDRFDEIVKENERIVIGKQEGAMSGWNVDGGTKFVDRDITEPLSDLGCKFDGAYGGFQPKPAVEVIIVVMKPMTEPTFVGQALDNGKGITWLDDCRVPYASDGDGGRFPANLLVSDDVLDDGKERNQGHWSKTKTTGFGEFGGGKSEYFGVGEKNVPDCYSRFFSLDAWAEKNLPFLIVPKASKREKNNGCDEFEDKKCRDNRKAFVDNAFQRGETPRKNNHPTVKPIKLMSYLITMGSRKGEVVLDPFAGSMSTGCACVLGGRKYIMIEKEAEYVEIGKARLKYYEDKIQEELFK